MTFGRSLEMSITRDEFLRLLPAAVPSFEVDGGLVRWTDAEHRGTIRMVPLSARQLGIVAVERHRVEIELADTTDAEGDAFMQRFHRAFLRGGG